MSLTQIEELDAELKLAQERHEKERVKLDKRRHEGLQAVEEAARMAEQAQTERDQAQQALHDLSAQVKAFTGRLLHHKQSKTRPAEVSVANASQLSFACMVCIGT